MKVRADRVRSGRITGMSTDIDSRRQAAQADFRRAADSIDALFDAKSALVLALDAVVAAAGGPDPLRAALDVGDLLGRVHDSVAVVHAAALEAAEHIPQKAVATHLDSKVALVFPRPAVAAAESSQDRPALPPPPLLGTL